MPACSACPWQTHLLPQWGSSADTSTSSFGDPVWTEDQLSRNLHRQIGAAETFSNFRILSFCNERQPLLGCLCRLLPVSHSNNPTYIHLLVLFLSRTLTNTRGKGAMVSGLTPALLWPTEHPSPPRAFSLPRFLSPSLPIPSRPV